MSNIINDISSIYYGQIVESYVPGKPAEKLGAVTDIPQDEREAARERTLAKAKAMRAKKGLKSEEYVGEAVKGADTEMRREASKERRTKDGKRLPPSEGRGYATQQKQSISFHNKRSKGKHIPGFTYSESLDPVGKEDADVDNDGKKNTKSDKYLLNRRKAVGKAISTQEAKEVKRWWDDDGDGIGYEKGEVSGKFKKKKRAVKEGFSNWRDDLVEVADLIDKEENEGKIEEKKVKNKIKINPSMGEAVENLGGTLLEMVEIEDFEEVFDDLSESDIFLLTDGLIEEVVEEVFEECLQEGYDLLVIENILLESLEISSEILNEAKVTFGHDTDIKSDRLEKVKSAVKKVGKGLARGAGYVAGAAVRGAKALGKEVSTGYKRGRHGAEDSSESGSTQQASSSTTTSSSDESDKDKKPGLLSRIGSKLKRGLKKVIAKGARAVSRGARNVARKIEGNDKSSNASTTKTKVEKPADPWEGSATTPKKPKAKAKPAAKPKATPTPTPKPKTTKAKKTNKLDDLLSSIRSESISIDEKVLTAAETKKKEELVKSMKSKAADFEDRYPGRGKEVMYATATKIAKKMAEQNLDEIAPLVVGGLALGGAALAGKAISDRMNQQRNKVTGSAKPSPSSKSSLSDKMKAKNDQMRELMNQSYEPEGEVIDERRKEEKGTPRKPRDAAFELVSKMMGSSRMGVQPRGEKKIKGKKPLASGEYGSERRSPKQILAGRRSTSQNIGSRFD